MYDVILQARPVHVFDQEMTLENVSTIEIGGVTNLAAGLFLAQDQFIHIQIGIRKKA